MNTQIIVMDFGSQYAHLISRRVRDLGVFSEVVPNDLSAGEIKKNYPDIKGIILSGGPDDVVKKDAPQCDKLIFDSGIPVLGLCYGHHIIGHYLGGKVGLGKGREYGITKLNVIKEDKILRGFGQTEEVWMNHGNSVIKTPKGFEIIAKTDNCTAVIADTGKNIYGVQFHPEVTHTQKGKQLLSNFTFDICSAKKDWSMEHFIEREIDNIKKQVGNRRAIIGLSGGVDSSVAAVLMSKAIGKNLMAVFVDTGFMRLGEPEFIKETFGKWDMKLRMIDAKKRFYAELKGVTDPEQKRKIIGRLFIETFDRAAIDEKAEILVQGTIYPDRIESGTSKNASVIKSHHNVGGLPKEMKLELCEPLRDLYKDEVRAVAKKLNLPEELALRHPFPGPGLAIRIIGECTEKNVKIVQAANHIVLDELKKAGEYDNVWQAFAVVLPIKSVGVQGDARSYKQVVAIRFVNSIDAMSASFSKVPYELLEKISTRITNEIKEVNRVVYDITNKPPGTIEWE
ncbi:MAG: glutamine-hydrolyzing GMP synthase [archaeon]